MKIVPNALIIGIFAHPAYMCMHAHTHTHYTHSFHLNIALSRVRSFLPQLKHADSVLQQRMKEEPQENVDIENVADGQPCIEMVPHDVDNIIPPKSLCCTLMVGLHIYVELGKNQ